MKKYTIYDSNTQTVIATGRPWPTKDGTSQPPGLEAGVHILEEINGDDPDFDPETERLTRFGNRVYDVDAGTATRTRGKTTRDTREVKRAAMAASWRALPYDYIRGPYNHLFQSAIALLDAGDDAAAASLVADADANETIKADPTKAATFSAVKAGFVATINDLNS